jgi:hypothetical protein
VRRFRGPIRGTRRDHGPASFDALGDLVGEPLSGFLQHSGLFAELFELLDLQPQSNSHRRRAEMCLDECPEIIHFAPFKPR